MAKLLLGGGNMQSIIKIIISILGAALGANIPILIERYVGIDKLLNKPSLSTNLVLIYVVCGIIGAIIFFAISPMIINKGDKIAKVFEKKLQKRPINELLVDSVGLIIGLIIATLINSGPVSLIPIKWIGVLISILLYLVLGYLGISIVSKRHDDFEGFLGNARKYGNKPPEKEKNVKVDYNRSKPKILDTSVIIDGRISDIVRTGFIEGTLVIPVFVLDELRHVSDSADSLKRQRGRRGLDILNKIQKDMENKVEITDKDFDDIAEVDMKLLKLAQVLNGVVVTNDYNLNKVAEFQGVPVLNINELANAVKPIVLPGEEMTVTVIKEGKENAQGLAYLDDGTMIVIEGGRKFIGETIDTLVTSVLQTAAGRMIFVKPKVGA